MNKHARKNTIRSTKKSTSKSTIRSTKKTPAKAESGAQKNHQQKQNQEHKKTTSKSTIRSTQKPRAKAQSGAHKESTSKSTIKSTKKHQEMKKHTRVLLRVEAKREAEAGGFPFKVYLKSLAVAGHPGPGTKTQKRALLCYCARNPEARPARARHPKKQTVTMLLCQEPGGQAPKTNT